MKKNYKNIKTEIKLILFLLFIFGVLPKCLIQNKIVKKLYFIYQILIIIKLFIFYYFFINIFIKLATDSYHTFITLASFIAQFGLIFSYMIVLFLFVVIKEKYIKKLLKLINNQYKLKKSKFEIWKDLFLIIFLIIIIIYGNIICYLTKKKFVIVQQLPFLLEKIYLLFIYSILNIINNQIKLFNNNIKNNYYKKLNNIKKLFKINDKFYIILKLIENIFFIILIYCVILDVFVMEFLLISITKYFNSIWMPYLGLSNFLKLFMNFYFMTICVNIYKQVIIISINFYEYIRMFLFYFLGK